VKHIKRVCAKWKDIVPHWTFFFDLSSPRPCPSQAFCSGEASRSLFCWLHSTLSPLIEPTWCYGPKLVLAFLQKWFHISQIRHATELNRVAVRVPIVIKNMRIVSISNHQIQLHDLHTNYLNNRFSLCDLINERSKMLQIMGAFANGLGHFTSQLRLQYFLNLFLTAFEGQISPFSFSTPNPHGEGRRATARMSLHLQEVLILIRTKNTYLVNKCDLWLGKCIYEKTKAVAWTSLIINEKDTTNKIDRPGFLCCGKNNILLSSTNINRNSFVLFIILIQE